MCRINVTALKDGAKQDDQDDFSDLSSRTYEACSCDTRLEVSRRPIIKLVSTNPMIADAAMPATAATSEYKNSSIVIDDVSRCESE